MPDILALMGSPRRDGNTAVLLEAALAPMREAGLGVTRLDAVSLDVTPCAECFACQQVHDRPGCPVRDDMYTVYDAMLSADLVLFASPVFCWGIPAPLKAIMDRCYALFKFNTGRGCKVLIESRKCALLLTCGGDVFDGADLVVSQYKRFADAARITMVGKHWADHATTPDKIRANTQLLAGARDFGARLVRALTP